MSRFTKISVDGQDLPADAKNWVAVRDETTKLVWSAGEAKKPMRWKKAKAYAEKLDLCGWKWRLPTVEELFLLADRSRTAPAIDIAFFPECQSKWYWSGTVAAPSPSDSAWCVYFYDGDSSWTLQYDEGLVRAVRAG
ncbi:MAG TPA: DUF1566 domain-containing protein [Dehalococcoidia bacterium]|nr:DUF1566 domain-containing protein [Dehalococcoidia bacterium]